MIPDHHISDTVVAELLHGLGYSLQGNAKTREGRQHVDRDVQFRYLARRVQAAQRQQQPTISPTMRVVGRVADDDSGNCLVNRLHGF